MENFRTTGPGGRRVYVERIIWLWRKAFSTTDKTLILNNLLKHKFTFSADGVLLRSIPSSLNHTTFCDNTAAWKFRTENVEKMVMFIDLSHICKQKKKTNILLNTNYIMGFPSVIVFTSRFTLSQLLR